MDAEIDTTDNGGGNEEDVEVELFFRKPPEINNFELVKTFWIDPTEVIISTNDLAQEDQNNKPSSDPEVKVLQPLALRPLETAEDESGGSSCSHSEDVRLPDEILDEPLDDEVFEEENEKTENVETDLVFRQPKEKEMELVYTISKSAVFNLDDLEEEDEDVDVDLWFREPTDTRFELVYTIPLMEDVSVDSLGETLEDVPPAEELDNVVEEASVAEFTFKPIENDEETETVTTEVVTVLERGGEGSRDFIEKVKLTSNDTFDNFDDEGEDAFQNAFVKSVETPETPVPEYDKNQEDIIHDVSVSDVLKDAAEKLQIIQDSENIGTLKQIASAPEFVSDIRTPEGSPDETETTRFEISSVDEININTENVPFLQVTQDTDRVPSQEPSDYAQLESISSPDDVPDVDRTLNSLKNEDVFPKEAIPSEVPKIEVTPEAETQPVVGLEDSGIVVTPEVVDLSKEDVEKTLNAEDVITGDDGVLVAKPDVYTTENKNADDPVIDREDSGKVETSEVVELKQGVIEAALNSEDVLSDAHVMPQNETTQGDQPVEESGATESPSVVDLNSEVVTDSLNSEDVNSQTELLESSNQTSEDLPQSVLKLEDSGIVETPDVVELEKEDMIDALNSEDVLTKADGVQMSTEILDNETPIEDQPVVDLEDSGPTNIVGFDDEVVADNEDVHKEDDATPGLDEQVLKLEDSGIVETPEIVALDHQDVKDALNSEDALLETEGDLVSSAVTETSEATHQAATIDGSNEEETPVDNSMIGLEDGGDVETASVVELTNEIAADVLNSEDVTGVTSLSVVDSEFHEGEQEFNIEETPVVKLEDSGVAETPDIVELDREVVEDALNSEDVVNETTAVAEASESHEATQEEELHQEKTAAEDTVLGLEESGDVEPVDVVAVSNQEVADAMNGEDVVKVAEEVAGEEAEQVNSELPPEAEESVVDSQSEEEQIFIKNQEDQEKESTPVAGTEEETLVEKLVSMVEDTLPVDAIAISEKMDTPEESKETKPEASKPESESMVEADVADSSEDQSKPEEVVQKLVSMVENVLPAETVIPSEDVVSEEHIEEREEDEQPAEMSEKPTIMEKLVSMVENIVPMETQDESLSPDVEEQESNPVAENSEESKTPEDTQPEETFVEKFVSVVENALPVDVVLPSEDVLSEDHVEEPVIELSSENAEDSTILEKLTSVVESVLPSKDNKNIEEEKKTDENEETATENSELPAEPTIIEKLTSMVENVIPSKDSVPEEPVDLEGIPNEENEIKEVAVEPTLMEQLTSIVESVLPTQEPIKNTEEPANPTELVEKATPEDSAAPEPTLMEKLTSMVESVLPSKDEVSEENHVETTVEVSETNDAVTEPTILEKLATMVENVLPADAILLSDYVRQSEERNSEARQAEELDPSDQVPLVQIEHLEEVSATQDSAVTTEAEEVFEPEEEKVSGEIVPSFEDTTSDDRAGEFEKPNESLAEADKRDDLDTVLDTSEDPSKPEEANPAPEETMEQKLVSMVENVLPAEAVLSSEDVVSEEDKQPAETSENPTVMEKLVPMVENIIPVETSLETQDESLSSAVEEQESNRVEKDSEETRTPEDTQPEETFAEKLVSIVENVLPVSAPQEEPNDTQRHLNEENQIISTSDIILPFEENTSLETPFDAEGFAEPLVEKEKQESFKEPTAEDIIETADIILPVEEEKSKNIETPFDAEGFVSEDPVETPVKNEIQQEDVPDETEPEKSTVVEELLAMAVDILPIDGTVAEKIEEKSLVEKTTVEAFETPNEKPGEFRESGTSDPELAGEAEYVPEESQPLPEKFERVKRGDQMEKEDDENEMQVATVEVEVDNEPQEMITPSIQVVEVTVQSDDDHPEDVPTSSQDTEEPLTKTDQHQEPHKITDVHFDIPKHHDDYGNDYAPFGTEPSARVEFNNPEESKEEEEDFVAELNFHPIRQWKDEDVISLQSLKSLVAEVGCTTDVSAEPQIPADSESTLKILKVVPSEPSLMELDISNDPSVIHVPIPLLEPATKYLEEMVEWIIADAVKEVGEMEVVTESEISEMVAQESENECPVPEPLADLKLPTEDDEKTPEPETPIEVARVIPVEVEPVQTIPQRPPRAPKVEGSKLDTSKSLDQHKSKVRFRPLNIKLGRSYSEEQQKELVEMLERPLTVITSSEQKPSEPKPSPLSPNTLDEYEHVPMMDMQSVPHSPQEKLEEVVEENEEQKEPEDLPMVEQVEQPVGFVKKVEVKTVETPEDVNAPQTKIFITETRILGAGKSTEYVDDEDGSECLDSIGDLSERTIQRFNTSIDDPSIRRDSFSSISSFGDRQKFRTAIENIRQDLLPFQSSVSQYLDPSVNPSQQLLVTNLSMDSPSDLSPNAPPAGYENTAQYLEKLQQEDRPSAEGSIDSSGFEKVDHESLEDYTAPVHDPMQKSVFGSLTADSDDLKPQHGDDGFVFIERNEANEGTLKKMSSHHDDVIEKNYFGSADDAATAKLLESPIAEEARKLVQDAVESASEYSKHATGDDDDEIGRELLDNVQHKFEQVKEPVADTLHKAYDGLGDFVHETVPQAVDNFVEEVKNRLPESPVPEKVETPEPLVDIHDSVDQVHDEIDNYLRREPTPPLVAADENAPSFDEKPQFGNQTPEEDETTYDRKGPLTIPEEVEKAAAAHKYEDEDLDEFDPLVTGATGAAFGVAVGAAAASEALTEEEMFGHQKFETVPRPPTPPKELNDDDVKPSTVNLGPAHHHSHPSSPHHSILKHHGEAWFDFKTVPPCVLDVIYWRDAKKSAIVLSLALLALFILAKYPLLTVVTYSLLLALGAAAGFRAYKKIEAQIKKTDTENPFNEILAKDLSLPQEKVHAQADVITEHATCVANKLKKLIFVESPLESIKFGLILWSLTYVASWFSGCTLAVLALLGTFSIPKVYEANQDAIDPHLATISGHLKNVQNLIDEKLPFLRSAPVAAEEKKDQ